MTPWRYTGLVKAHPRWATVYFDPATHRALRLKAAGTDRSVSELINEAVSLSLLEDAEDLAAFEQRARAEHQVCRSRQELDAPGKVGLLHV